MIRVTLDTGALIAMENRKPRANMLLLASQQHRAELLAITPVIAEWWRGPSDRRNDIKRAVTVVPFPVAAAQAAGICLGETRDGHRAGLAVDAMVMAFAATYGGGLVYTSDIDDLTRLQRQFPSVRLLSV